MYIVDLFKRLVKKTNIPLLIYLVLNVLVITFLISIFSGSNVERTNFVYFFIQAFVLYVISVMIALSPLGESIVRFQVGCKSIEQQEIKNLLEPIFSDVYIKAKKLDPTLPSDIRLFMNDDETPNAFAIGRKTICITKGMLNVPAEQIKAVLAHEFGHLSNKDTDLIMLVTVGNLIVSGVISIIRVLILVFRTIIRVLCVVAGNNEGALMHMATTFFDSVLTIFMNCMIWLWTEVGVLLVMKSSRDNEYVADEFSFNCGYGKELCILLNAIDNSSRKLSLFETLACSHPHKAQRIARLQKLDVVYR